MLQFYLDDLPHPISIKSEIELWQRYWLRNDHDFLPTNYSDTLKAVNFDAFQNIKVLLVILGELPTTSCQCERSFSGMKRVKTELSSKMGQQRMNDLSMLNFHADKTPSPYEVTDRYMASGDHRIPQS